MKKVSYIITIINILFQVIYMTIGTYKYIELSGLNSIFYIFRPEYFLVSGIVGLINIFLLIIVLIKNKKAQLSDIIILLLNIEYIIYYYFMLRVQ